MHDSCVISFTPCSFACCFGNEVSHPPSHSELLTYISSMCAWELGVIPLYFFLVFNYNISEGGGGKGGGGGGDPFISFI